MNCALSIKQQKLLLGKVAIDLDESSKFDFKNYAKDIYDLINNKTGDKVLAANYVSMLPTNIWAVMGVNKPIRRKFSGIAGQMSELEAQFEDFTKVQNFINEFATQ